MITISVRIYKSVVTESPTEGKQKRCGRFHISFFLTDIIGVAASVV